MYGGPRTNGFRSNRASSLASGTISVCGVGLASDHPQKEQHHGKFPLLNFFPAASRMKTRSPSSSASSASSTSKRRQMSEMMCSMCGFGDARAPPQVAAAGTGGERLRGTGAAAAAFELDEFEVDEGSTAAADVADDADERDVPLLPPPLVPLPPLAASSSGHRASPQRRRSSATRSALQGGRCEFFCLFFFF